MTLFKIPQSIHKISTHALAIILAVMLTVSCLLVLPSQAEPATDTMIAQRPSAAIGAISSKSFVTAAVNRVGKSVVRIDTEKTITRRVDPFMDDPFFRGFFGENFPQQSRTQQLRGLGSGFIFDSSGLIITNAHVVDQADKVTIRLKDGRNYEGNVTGIDEVTDLAVVKINTGEDLPVAPLGSSENVQVGDWAIAVGNPLGFDNTVTLGIISTLKRSSAKVGIDNKRLEFIQTDAAINPGNSGGPLLNAEGEVIGINTAIRADAMGIGFAIPIDKAKAIAMQLQRGEEVPHPYLGVQMVTLTPDLAKENNSDPNSPFLIPEVNGVLVFRVLPNTPAATAGIRRGDVIVEIDGQAITTAEQLQAFVENSNVDQVLKVQVRRGNRTQIIAVRTAQLQDIS